MAAQRAMLACVRFGGVEVIDSQVGAGLKHVSLFSGRGCMMSLLPSRRLQYHPKLAVSPEACSNTRSLQ